MSLQEVNEQYQISAKTLDNYRARLNEVNATINGAEQERDTLHALIAAEEMRYKSLGQHLPQEAVAPMMQSMGMARKPVYDNPQA